MFKKSVRIASVCALAWLSVACASPKQVPYFQDLEAGSSDKLVEQESIKIRPDDKISIIVKCSNNEITSLFNLPYVTTRLGTTTETTNTNYSNSVLGYLVDRNGNIDFPLLGTIHVAGMTREEITEYIKNEIITRKLAKDPVVTVEYMNLRITVMGEITKPGRYNIDHDGYTILDAISVAGDLTINGLRENVKVLRTVNGLKETYEVNLCSAQDVFNSPVYYLQQNDIIYIEPNKVRARQSTVNGNNLLSASFWISISSLVVTILNFIIK